MTPEFGQHTEEILLELGYDWEKMQRYANRAPSPDPRISERDVLRGIRRARHVA